MKRAALFLTLALTAFSQANPDDYRGGWRTDDEPGGALRVYQFVIKGEKVTGVYCTWCNDLTTLAFIEGSFGNDGLSFTVNHVDNNGKITFSDKGTAKFERPNLIVNVTLGGPKNTSDTGRFTWTMIKDIRGPDPLPIPIIMLPPRDVPVTGGRGGGGAGAPKAAPKQQDKAAPKQQAKGPAAPKGGGAPGGGRGGYEPPGPYHDLTPDVITGAWLGFGNGPDKQYFIIKKYGDKLMGMVCGRCDNPYTMAALDDFRIEGKVLHFDIMHEDWGDYSIPFEKHVAAIVSGNEMRMVFYQDNLPPEVAARGQNSDPFQGGTILLGPIRADATVWNHWHVPEKIEPRY